MSSIAEALDRLNEANQKDSGDPLGDFMAGLGEDAEISWQKAVYDQIESTIKSISKSVGIGEDVLLGWYRDEASGMIGFLNRNAPSLRVFGSGEEPWSQQGPDSIIDYSDLYQRGLEYLALQDPSFGQLFASYSTAPKGGGPAAPKLTAKNFDLDSLALQATDMWRAYLLEEPTDARALARSYMEARLADPEQALDYQTFVYNQMKRTGRYQSIYRNKPAALSETAYISPYMQAAMNYVRPRDAAQLAAGGAMLGADPGSFNARLKRTNSVRKSAPFIRGLEDTLSQVRGVLVG